MYLNYGIHRCLNLACDAEGTAGGVLLRAGEVLEGRDLAVQRRGGRDTGTKLLSGPGRLGQGLGVELSMDAQPVTIGASTEPVTFVLKPPSEPVRQERRRHGPRVGVSGVGGSTAFPWRWWIDGDRSVSSYRPGKNVPGR